MSTIIFCTKHERFHGKFIVIDWYEGYDIIGKGLSFEVANDLYIERVDDTDGECDVGIYRMVYNPSESGKLIEVESY